MSRLPTAAPSHPVSMSVAPAWSGSPGHAGVQEQRQRWERKRKLAAAELLLTERRYCQQLGLLTTVGSAAPTVITA